MARVFPIIENAVGGSIIVPQVISVNSASPALTVIQAGAGGGVLITNTGAGYSFKVEDSASTDTTPFIIDAAGLVGIGIATPLVPLHVVGEVRFVESTGNARRIDFLPDVTGGLMNIRDATNVSVVEFDARTGTTAFAKITGNVRIFRPGIPGQYLDLSSTGGEGNLSAQATPLVIAAGTYVRIAPNNTEKVRFDVNGNVLIGVTAAGTTAATTLQMANGTAPTANIAGGQLYVVGGILYFRGSAGTVTPLTLVP